MLSGSDWLEMLRFVLNPYESIIIVFAFMVQLVLIILFASLVINQSEKLNYLDYTIESIQTSCFLVFLDISLRLNLKPQMRAQLFHVSTSLRSKRSFASQ